MAGTHARSRPFGGPLTVLVASLGVALVLSCGIFLVQLIGSL